MKRLLLLVGVGALLLVASSRAPQIFEAGCRTCVYIGGELDCFQCAEPSCFTEEVHTTPQIPIKTGTPTPRIPTNTPEFTATIQPTVTSVPTNTPSATICEIWVCHKPNTPAMQDYCCESSAGCLSAHLGHGDYEGKCR